MPKKNQMCETIVEAARKRFAHYGFGKTTMSEIAKDCKMSPGNLYRYFDGKLDIAEEIAKYHVENQLDCVCAIARDTSQSAQERLRAYFLYELRDGYKTLEEEPKMQEIADIISRERVEFSEWLMGREQSLISEILAAGNANKEFDIPDVMQAAKVLQAATMKFRLPQMHSPLSLEKLELELIALLDLFMSGLEPRETADSSAT